MQAHLRSLVDPRKNCVGSRQRRHQTDLQLIIVKIENREKEQS